MARYTVVYGDFLDRLDEVNLLRSKAGRLARNKNAVACGAEIQALCRACIVLLSSHIEAYVKELGEHTLDKIYEKEVGRSKIAIQFFYHISKDKIENIKNGSNSEKIARNVHSFVSSDAAIWSTVGKFPVPISATDFNKGFSNPKFDKIKTYLSRFGYSEFRYEFFKTLGSSAQFMIGNLDQIVDTRNAIAHGDPSATKTPKEVEQMIDTAKSFCRYTDSLFSAWCGKNLCKIR
jgi:hypothetical protein